LDNNALEAAKRKAENDVEQLNAYLKAAKMEDADAAKLWDGMQRSSHMRMR